MSYAIIRNSKYTRANLMGIYRHNERKNTSYTNKNIRHDKTKDNYSFKSCDTNYLRKFDEIRKTQNLKGYLKKNSNVLCEYVITSDKEFFKTIGEEETKRYFETAYKFVASYKNLGEQYIISANVHMDEETPHMHITFIPVIHELNKKSGKTEDKISCSEFWKGKDSYRILQDNFYKYMVRAGFYLDRGRERENEHIPIEKLKKVTNYEMQEMFKESNQLEQEVESNNIVTIKEHYRLVLKKYNTLAKRYTKVKNIVDNTLYKAKQIEQENRRLNQEMNYLEREKTKLEEYINNVFEVVKVLFDFPVDRLKRIIDNFIKDR